MFTNQTTFIANLVRKGELKQSSNGNPFIQLNLAKNYSIKDGNDWIELNPVYIRVTIWGKEAELFNASNIPAGTPLLIVGKITGERTNPYVNAQGVQVPSEDREQVIVDAIAPLIGRGRKVDVSMGTGGNTQRQTPQAPQPATQNNLFNSPSQPEPQSSNDLFGSPVTSSDDLFGDIFS